MKILMVNACVRGEESRTWKMAEAYLKGMKENAKEAYSYEQIDLMEEDLHCMSGAYYRQRDALIETGNLNHPLFKYAHQFAEADIILVAAPFWDLSFPAILKVYIENISVGGITFGYSDTGMYGMCKAKKLVFLTTRGGTYGNGPLEQGARYMEALCVLYGIEGFSSVIAEGLDERPDLVEERMETACKEAWEAGAALLCE